MFRIEVVIDTKVALIAINIGTVSKSQVQTFHAANELDGGRVQSVTPASTGRVVVRRGHTSQRFLNICAVADSRTQRVSICRAIGNGCAIEGAITEQVNRSQISRRIGWPDRIAESIDSWIRASEVRVIRAWEKSKDALLCVGRQRVARGKLALQIALTFK